MRCSLEHLTMAIELQWTHALPFCPAPGSRFAGAIRRLHAMPRVSSRYRDSRAKKLDLKTPGQHKGWSCALK
jgi:hypothetical protein